MFDLISDLAPLLIVVAIIVAGAVIAVISWIRKYRKERTLRQALSAENERLSKYKSIENAEAKAAEIISTARQSYEAGNAQAISIVNDAKREATEIVQRAEQEARANAEQAAARIASANGEACTIIEKAEAQAEEIAGDARRTKENAEIYEKAIKAFKNKIEGFGNEYLIPAHSLLDDLAEEYGHLEAGQELTKALASVKSMIEHGTAAICSYVEPNRRAQAIAFVLDAFNGKVDSSLARVRHDNYGNLRQMIEDAFATVNLNGMAFREAGITKEYKEARLKELKWAAVVQQLKLEEREEQKRIKEQIREEEKARKEYERAMRDAAKEEELLRKAMEKAQQAAELATAEERAKYELQLKELSERLRQTEEKNQRALSMAQQTKKGNVYIISNIGSFGEHVYKIGVTRRLDPLDRIRELGDSSVPFEFDVHALIMSDNAPALEHKLHKHFIMKQLNKVNYRKEFFRVELAEIRREIESLEITANWTMMAAARQYRETLAIEERIKHDSKAKEAWVNRQLQMDLTRELEEEQVEVNELVGAPREGS